MDYAGQFAALGTALCWVATALSFEAAGRRVGSLTVNLARLVMAVGLLALQGWWMRGLPFPTDAPPEAWLWLSVSGLVGFTFGDLCLFRAFVVLGSRLSTLMMSLAPPLTAVLGWLVLGEVLAPRDLLGMALTVGGIAWAVLERRRPTPAGAPKDVATPGAQENTATPGAQGKTMPTGAPQQDRAPAPPSAFSAAADLSRSRRVQGVLLGLGGAVGQAGGLVLSKLGMGEYDAFASTQIRVLAGTVGYVLLFTALGWWSRLPAVVRDRRALGFTAVGAFFGPFLGVGLSLVSVQLIPAGVAASLMATTPVLIIPVVVLAGKERVGPGGVAGALLAVAGVAVLFL